MNPPCWAYFCASLHLFPRWALAHRRHSISPYTKIHSSKVTDFSGLRLFRCKASACRNASGLSKADNAATGQPVTRKTGSYSSPEVMLGCLLFALPMLRFFPLNTGILLSSILLQWLGIFLYGAFSVLPALFISSFVRNRYLICCFPFIIVNYLYIGSRMLSNHYWASGQGDTASVGCCSPYAVSAEYF